MRRLISIVAFCYLVNIAPTDAGAAPPSSITVQGKLTNAGGSPLPAGAKSFTFRIFDAATLGSQIWPSGGAGEIQSITTSTDGLWVGLVGAVSPLTDPVFADSVRWLEIIVDGTTLPRVRLVTGPYAFHVATVDGASGGNISSSLSIGSGHTMTGNQVFAAGSDHEVTGDRASISGGRTNHATGQYSHIGGGQNNTADTIGATVGGGQSNAATQSDAVVAGGSSNSASGDRGAIIGGVSNVASGAFSTLGGGFDNEASGSISFVGGGNHTYARGQAAFVGGGGGSNAFIGTDADSNSASGDRSGVVGGHGQLASGEASLIGGGGKNRAGGDYAFIGGGSANIASGDSAVIAGGSGNIASGIGSAVVGGRNNRAHGSFSFVGGGDAFGGDSNNVAGGAYSVIGGGILNYASGSLGSQTIAGGERNAATGFAATVGGGRSNKARGTMSFVGGGGQANADPGDSNVASGLFSAIVCGLGNRATDSGSFVGSGRSNTASGRYATILGGLNNTADGDWAGIPGGRLNSAAQTFSFAAGYRAKANHYGTFVWADSTNSDFASSANNQFLIRASGGVGIGTNVPEAPLHVLDGSAGTVTANSSSVAVFERTSGGYISILSSDASERGILFGSPANALMGGIRFNPAGAPKGFNFRAGTNLIRLVLDSLGNLTADGCIVGSNIACPSDGRFKRDIATLPNALATVEKLRGVHYNWKTDEFPDRDFPTGEQIGLVAQEVQKIVPQAVVPMTDGYLAVDYSRLVPLLIEAIKEQNERIDQLQKTIQSLKQ